MDEFVLLVLSLNFIFRQSLLHVELTLEIETDSYENDEEITEEHYFQRKVFLGNYFLNTNV